MATRKQILSMASDRADTAAVGNLAHQRHPTGDELQQIMVDGVDHGAEESKRAVFWGQRLKSEKTGRREDEKTGFYVGGAACAAHVRIFPSSRLPAFSSSAFRPCPEWHDLASSDVESPKAPG